MSTLPTIDALGTRWWIEIFDAIDETKRAAIYDGCALLLSEFEARYSRFRSDSLVSTLNRVGVINKPDAALGDILSYGITLYARSRGAFNVLIGEKLIARGYDASYSFTATPHTTPVPNPEVSLTLTPERITLQTGAVDIGGYGKGYVIDLLAEYLRTTWQVHYFLINGGGDMYGTSDHHQPITVYLEHPTNPSQYLDTTTILNQGFAASSPHKRTWRSETETLSHIVHSDDAPLVADATFIKAKTARDADAFATVGLITAAETFAEIAATEQLAFARFSLADGSLERNGAF